MPPPQYFYYIFMPAKKKQQSLWFILIGIVGFGLISAVLWLQYQKIRFVRYNHPQFSVKYPALWTREENKNGAEVILYSPMENELDLFQENVNVVVQDVDQRVRSLQEYSEMAIMQMKVVFEKNIEIRESAPTYLSGNPAHKLVFIGHGPDGDLEYMVAWTLAKGKAYQITYTSMADSYDKYLPQVEKIFNSLDIK